jgi:hypothetical protein
MNEPVDGKLFVLQERARTHNVPLELARVMSDETLRSARQHVQYNMRDKPLDFRWPLNEDRRMVVALKHVTEAEAVDDEDRAAWRAFWARWDAKHGPTILPTAAEVEQARREEEMRRERQRAAEMRAARDAYLAEPKEGRS